MIFVALKDTIAADRLPLTGDTVSWVDCCARCNMQNESCQISVVSIVSYSKSPYSFIQSMNGTGIIGLDYVHLVV